LNFGSCQECGLVKPSVLLFCIFLYLLISYNRYGITLSMFSVILFIVYFDYILSIVRMSLYSSIRSYSVHSLISWVSGRHCVSMVLIRCLPTNAPYISGHVVDCGSDTPVESFVVHSPNIGQVGPGCEGRLALFFIFLSNIPYV
jgi:hypothetical protein